MVLPCFADGRVFFTKHTCQNGFMQQAVGTRSLLTISSFYCLMQLDSLTKSKALGNCGKSKMQVGEHGPPFLLPEGLRLSSQLPWVTKYPDYFLWEGGVFLVFSDESDSYWNSPWMTEMVSEKNKSMVTLIAPTAHCRVRTQAMHFWSPIGTLTQLLQSVWITASLAFFVLFEYKCLPKIEIKSHFSKEYLPWPI